MTALSRQPPRDGASNHPMPRIEEKTDAEVQSHTARGPLPVSLIREG